MDVIILTIIEYSIYRQVILGNRQVSHESKEDSTFFIPSTFTAGIQHRIFSQSRGEGSLFLWFSLGFLSFSPVTIVFRAVFLTLPEGLKDRVYSIVWYGM